MYLRHTPGTTAANLSEMPLATEEESTPGPDDWNPFDDERVSEDQLRQLDLDGYSPSEQDGFEFEPELPEF